jgi:alpha-1,6-mannosyltransferase
MDVTKFYSDASGGVRTYLDAKIRDFEGRAIEHVLVIPAAQDGVTVEGRTRVYRVAGPVIRFSPHYRLLVSRAALARIIERERPDVIEVGSPFLVPWLVRSALAGQSVATVGFYHSDLVRTYAEPLIPHRLGSPVRVVTRNLARAYVRQVYRRMDVTVAASRVVAQELRDFGIRDVRCVPLGVDLDVFAPDPRERGWLHDVLRVPRARRIGLFVGRFCAEKRLDVVLAANLRVPPERRPHLVLVGDGPHRPRLEALARQRDDLSLLPYLSHRRGLARIYRGADFYVAAGPGETFGLAIAEAMACGLPVVCVDRGAAPDRVRGSRCHVLYRHGDADSCATALEAIVGRGAEDERESAARHARQFAWARTFDAMHALYGELARRSVPR